MANFIILVPFLHKAEGGLSRDKTDTASKFPCPTPYQGKTGWHTNKGITYQNWVLNFGRSKDDRFFKMNTEDWAKITKSKYWDKWKADQIISQKVANILVDYVFNSGSHGIKNVQKLVGVNPDGVVGPKTLDAVNKQSEKEFLTRLYNERYRFYDAIIRSNPTQAKFKNGWYNRVKDLKSFNDKLK